MSQTHQLSEHGCPLGHLDVCAGTRDFHKQTDSLPFPVRLCQMGPECLLSTFPAARVCGERQGVPRPPSAREAQGPIGGQTWEVLPQIPPLEACMGQQQWGGSHPPQAGTPTNGQLHFLL